MCISMMKIFLLVLFHTLILELQLSGSALFEEELNLSVVEEIVIDYARIVHEAGQTNAVPISNGICNQEEKIKVTLCKQLLENGDEYPLDFTFLMNAKFSDLKCHEEKFIIQILNHKYLETDKLPMYKCPFVAQSELLIVAPSYYVAECHKEGMALIFRQTDSYSHIKANRFWTDINFAQLSILADNFYGEEGHRMQQVDDGIVEKFLRSNEISQTQLNRNSYTEFSRLWNIYNSVKPFEKFQQTYAMTNVCGLKISQKIFICQKVVPSFASKFRIDITEFSILKCIKRELFPTLETQGMYFLPCAPLIKYSWNEAHQLYRKTYDTTLFFIASCLPDPKTNITNRFVLSLLSKYKGKIMPQFVIENPDFHKLDQIEEISRRTRNRNLDRMIQSSAAAAFSKHAAGIPKYEAGLNVRINRYNAELDALKMIRIQQTKLVYTKFKMAYNAQSICAESTEVKLKLCKDIFEHQVFGYYISNTSENNFKCLQEPATVHVLQPIVPQMFIGYLYYIQCPTPQPLEIDKGLYLSGSSMPDTIVSYSLSDQGPGIYPLATIPVPYLIHSESGNRKQKRKDEVMSG